MFKKFKMLFLITFMLCFGSNIVHASRSQISCSKSSVNGQNIHGGIFKNLNKQMLNHLSKKIKLNKSLICGGKYRALPTATFQGIQCERHHLISSSFCRKHHIEVKRAPCVLIPRTIHKKTGSYGNSRKSKEYFKQEETAYKSGGLKAVLKLGVEDLKPLIKDFNENSAIDMCYDTSLLKESEKQPTMMEEEISEILSPNKNIELEQSAMYNISTIIPIDN